MSDSTPSPDDIPTDAELDALQAQIEDAKAEQGQRGSNNGKRETLTLDPSFAPDMGDMPLPSDVAAQRVAELETEMAAMKDRALRAMADAENVKKRSAREVENAKAYGVERFAGDMLSVYDNMSRALMSVDDTAVEDLGENAKKLIEGLELTEKSLVAALSRHGVKPVPGVGSKFDPNVHQAVANIPSDEVAKGDVAEVMQMGFTIGKRTLRAAMVAVSTGPG